MKNEWPHMSGFGHGEPPPDPRREIRRVYVSGPMTGIPNFNSSAFTAAEKLLRQSGFFPINPIALDAAKGDTYIKEREKGVWESDHRTEYLRRDIMILADPAENVQYIYMLEGWEKSEGARLEKAVAEGLGLTVLYEKKGGKLPKEAIPLMDIDPADQVLAQREWQRGMEHRVLMDGYKADEGKLPHYLLPFDALMEVSKVLQFGAKKYAPRNWEKGMAWHRPFRAILNHLWEWWGGKKEDEETKLSPLAHAACEALFLLAYEIRKIGEDDRP